MFGLTHAQISINMGRLHKGQTRLRITLFCGEITGVATALIKYKKPGGALGYWTATVVSETTGEIYYDVANTSDLDMEGAWTVWSHITFDDGDVAAGDPVKMAVYTEGSNRPLRLVWN